MRHIESADDFSKSVCNFLIKSNAKINIEDRYGQTPLHYAAMRGNEIVAKELLALPGINLEVIYIYERKPSYFKGSLDQCIESANIYNDSF